MGSQKVLCGTQSDTEVENGKQMLQARRAEAAGADGAGKPPSGSPEEFHTVLQKALDAGLQDAATRGEVLHESWF